jgi:hypothetical protein
MRIDTGGADEEVEPRWWPMLMTLGHGNPAARIAIMDWASSKLVPSAHFKTKPSGSGAMEDEYSKPYQVQ